MNHLKLLILSSAFLTLPGCALLDAYFMAKYDTTEYSLINKIRTTAELNVTKCDDRDNSKSTFVYIHAKSLEFKNFTQYIPDNGDAYKLAGNIHDLSKQGIDAYNNESVSPTFCRLKLQQIVRASESSQKIIGSKPR
jgi:hypothetical protein